MGSPSYACCYAELQRRFPNPSKIKISSRSTLVILRKGGERGSGGFYLSSPSSITNKVTPTGGVVIESLDLDGALLIECEDGADEIVRDLVVRNEGWKFVPLSDDDNNDDDDD